MFTNWLTGTGTTGLTNSNARLNELNPNVATTASLSLLNNHNLANFNSNIMTTPPDVILEVGPGPSSMRFMAHGLILGMHSGYLRSAIRLDERTATAAASAEGHSSAGGIGPNTSSDIIVYLTNVTAEQFAPLLTYMYTGYLDLNVENIFGVLLATHVLHMPRALEICRSYLARAQNEGYFGPNNNPNLNASNGIQNLGLAVGGGNGAAGKIIRPIASKPQLGNFGFLPLNHAAPPSASVPLNAISAAAHNSIINNTAPLTAATPDKRSNRIETPPQKDNEEDDIDVDEVDRHSLNNENYQLANDIHNNTTTEEDDEDVEVFIDSNSEAEVVVEPEIQKLCFKKLNSGSNSKKSYQEKATAKSKSSQRQSKSQHHHSSSSSSKNERRKKSSSGLQVAKAPIPASQLDNSEANKVIIDVASCDGPVRFKRILNTAYGHKPEMCAGNSLTNRSGLVERSLQSVSLSFHQQMAKTISQQQQLQQAEESENSETSNGSLSATNARSSCQDKASGGNSSSSGRKIQSEVFVCVYCKHTFKSQYCYQKHAKRHLNPLTLQATCVPDNNKVADLKDEATKAVPSVELQITKHANVNTTRAYYSRSATQLYSGNANTPTTPRPLQSSSSASTVDYLRREVRPLDMNVQYYPCKTCGSKFPSYYFVHKHRKMCHADEEAQQQTNLMTTGGGAAGTGAGDNTTTNSSTAASGSANVNAEECLNSQSSD